MMRRAQRRALSKNEADLYWVGFFIQSITFGRCAMDSDPFFRFHPALISSGVKLHQPY
jgi:hypothetical protein